MQTKLSGDAPPRPLSITTEELAEQVGVHRNTIARWSRAGWLRGGRRTKHPSGRGWTTIYAISEVSRGATIKRLLADGLSGPAVSALQHQERSENLRVLIDRAAAIYNEWASTIDEDEKLDGTHDEIGWKGDAPFVRYVYPISSHISVAVRRTLQNMGISEERSVEISGCVDSALIREAIQNVLAGLAPVLVVNGSNVFVAPAVALSPLHSGEELPPPDRSPHDSASTHEALLWATEAAGYVTVRLYPILRTVWGVWGKQPMPRVANHSMAAVGVRVGDDIVEYDCFLTLRGTHERITGIWAEFLHYTARVYPSVKSANRQQPASAPEQVTARRVKRTERDPAGRGARKRQN